jgi:hypothetical protein
MRETIGALRGSLEQNGVGSEEFTSLLVDAWPDLMGSSDSSMTPAKLHRVEKPAWEPPLLRFQIERHGAIVGGGSTRAEIQFWEVNLDNGTAEICHTSWRQVRPMSPRFNAQQAADEIVGLVLQRAEDDRLAWSEGGQAVRVVIANIGPLSVGYTQTLQGRHSRFCQALDAAMTAIGWRRGGSGYLFRMVESGE